MTKTKIAAYSSCSDCKPKINTPSIYGASSGKPFLLKIAVTGKKPIRYSVLPKLPDGLELDSETGIISGSVKSDGNYRLTIVAENSIGTDKKELLIEIKKDNVLRTPLMGWTSWNAYRNTITQEKILKTAEIMIESGLADYGYQYVNVDSGWQGIYGGKFDAIMPNEKFPDMKLMCEKIHSMGLKAGIYSTPMLKAWGGGEYPGCTTEQLDLKYSNAYFGIGTVHKEQNNVDQWDEFGFDYLKYDWSPCDTENADIMRKCLTNSKRDYAYSVTVSAGIEFAEYWRENCNSWRDNLDSDDTYERLLGLFDSEKWSEHCRAGHYFDLDMLETGSMYENQCRLTEDEQIMAYTLRSIFPSPIQISCNLEKLTEFDMALLCNEEVISVNQDALGIGAYLISHDKTYDKNYKTEKHIKIYKKPLEDGSYAVAVFNLGETKETVEVPLAKKSSVRDLWAKEDLGIFEENVEFIMEPHTVRMIKCI